MDNRKRMKYRALPLGAIKGQYHIHRRFDSDFAMDNSELPRRVVTKVNCMRERHTVVFGQHGVEMQDHDASEFSAIEAFDAFNTVFGTKEAKSKESQCRCKEIHDITMKFLNGRYKKERDPRNSSGQDDQKEWKRLPKTFQAELWRRWNIRELRKPFQWTHKDNIPSIGRYDKKYGGITYEGKVDMYREKLAVAYGVFSSQRKGGQDTYINPYVIFQRYGLAVPARYHHSPKVVARLDPHGWQFGSKERHAVLVRTSLLKDSSQNQYNIGHAVWAKVPPDSWVYEKAAQISHYYSIKSGRHDLTTSQRNAWKKRYISPANVGQYKENGMPKIVAGEDETWVWGWRITVDVEERYDQPQ